MARGYALVLLFYTVRGGKWAVFGSVRVTKLAVLVGMMGVQNLLCLTVWWERKIMHGQREETNISYFWPSQYGKKSIYGFCYVIVLESTFWPDNNMNYCLFLISLISICILLELARVEQCNDSFIQMICNLDLLFCPCMCLVISIFPLHGAPPKLLCLLIHSLPTWQSEKRPLLHHHWPSSWQCLVGLIMN